MNLILANMPFILQGIEVTLWLSVVTIACSTVIAVVLGTLAVTRLTLTRLAIKGFVEVLRGIPLLVNIFFVFFVTPLLGISMSSFSAAAVSLSLWAGANGAEVVRGGLTVIPRHQWESAEALGFKSWEVFLLIIWPQALRSIIPPYIGNLTLLVQATSLGALVGVTEFFKVNQIIVERTTLMAGHSPAFIVYAWVLFFYFCICSCLSWAGRRVESKVHGREHLKSAA